LCDKLFCLAVLGLYQDLNIDFQLKKQHL